jgi:hypothetical protein
VGVTNRFRERDCFRRRGEAEARGELHAAQDAQGVFAESLGRVAKDFVLEIVRAAEEIEQLTPTRVEHHRVDGEVAARGGIARVDIWIERNLKALVPGRSL